MEPFRLLLWYRGMWFWCPPAFWLLSHILTESVRFCSAGWRMSVFGICLRISVLSKNSKGWGCPRGSKSYENALSFGMRKRVICKARSLPPQFSWRPFGGIVSRWCFQRFLPFSLICFIEILGKWSSIWGIYIFLIYAWLVQPPEVWYWMNSMNPNLGNSRCVKWWSL